MHSMLLRSLLLLLVLTAGRVLGAGEMVATGISLPFFNESGKLTHRLLAKTGTMSGGIQKLHGVELHYFSPTDPNVVVQKIEATEATWDEKKGTLVGRGPIAVATVENRLTGEGFDFALATSLLHIHRQFSMTNAEAVLTSDRATIELVVEKSGEDLKVRDIKRCEAIGNLHIVIQPAAQKRYRFKEVFSDLGVYDGVTKIVTLPHPTRTVQLDGGEGRWGKFEFLLEDQAKKSSPAVAPQPDGKKQSK
jgi:hypothetical protein